jgi:hypothetical protein
MPCRFRRAVCAILCAVVAAVGLLPHRANALDTPNVLMTIDGMTMLHQGLFRNAAQADGYNTFQFGPLLFAAGTLGRYKSFYFVKNGVGDGGISHNARNHSDAPEVWTGSAFAPVEFVDLDADYFPVTDRSTGGQIFDPNEYQIEVKFKPNIGVSGLPDNTAPLFNVGLDQTDGFVFDAEIASYKRANDAFTYNIGSAEVPINTWYETAPKDADGYATYTVPVSTPNFVQRGFYHAFGNADFRTNSVLTGNGRVQGEDLVWADANDGLDSLSFGGGPTGPTQQLKAPNGVPLISFGAPNAEAGLSLQLKYVSLKRITPGQIVGRIDANSGFTFRFGSGFTYGATQPNIIVDGNNFQPNATDQISRFDQNGMTNLILNMRQPDNTGETHRFVLRGGPSAETFDGSTATVNIRAKLLAGNTAPNLVIVAKDLDGNDNASNPLGADEYTFSLPLNQFNTSTFTTISVPLSSFNLTPFAAGPPSTPFGFANAGDGLRTDFNLYEFAGLVPPDTGLLKLELEYMEIRLPGGGVDVDLDNDNDVDGNDFLLIQRGLGSTTNAATIAEWKTKFGGPPATGAAAGVPEPSTALLAGCGLALIRCRRRS